MPNPYVMFAIARVLRQHVSFILAGTGYAEPTSPQPMSETKNVDAVVWLPPAPEGEWRVDATEISEEVQRWISNIKYVCQEFRISAVLTSNDHEQFFLTLARQQFEEIGVTILGPSHETVRAMNDKYNFSQVAASLGIPVPDTRMVTDPSSEDLLSGGMPVMLKRRFSQGTKGVFYFSEPATVRLKLAEISQIEPLDNWLLQEYIPGRFEPSCTVYMGARQPTTMLFHIKHRYTAPSASSAVEVVDPFVPKEAIANLVKAVGLVGACGIQFKLDERTGQAKMIEANARLGQNTRMVLPMLAKQGQDAGLILLNSYAGLDQEIVQVPVGTIGLSPFDDIVSIVLLLRTHGRRQKIDNPAPSLPEFLAQIASSYLGRPIAWDLIFSSLLQEQKPALTIFRRQLQRTKSPPIVPWSGISLTRPVRDVSTLCP